MLAIRRDLEGFAIGAVDGEIGRVKDAYFEDRFWTICYLVVETGHWLPGRRVLVAPRRIDAVDRAGQILHTALTRAQIAASPPIDTAKPVSRQQALRLARRGSLPYYMTLLGASMTLAALSFEADQVPPVRRSSDEARLRSVRAIVGLPVHAEDTDVGHVVDVLVDETSWRIRDLVVALSWWSRLRVLIPVDWVTRLSWDAGCVDVALGSETIRTAPPLEPARSAGPADEARVRHHYGPTPFTST